MCARVEAMVTMAPRARSRSAAAALASRNVEVRLVASTRFQVSSEVSCSGANGHTGVADHRVDAAETRPHHRDQPLDVRFPADVALHADAAHFGSHAGRRLAIDIGASHLPSGAAQMTRDRRRRCRVRHQ